eukprot:scaffold22506_cov136-Isochrysis_galbana.AAC.2
MVTSRLVCHFDRCQTYGARVVLLGRRSGLHHGPAAATNLVRCGVSRVFFSFVFPARIMYVFAWLRRYVYVAAQFVL